MNYSLDFIQNLGKSVTSSSGNRYYLIPYVYRLSVRKIMKGLHDFIEKPRKLINTSANNFFTWSLVVLLPNHLPMQQYEVYLFLVVGQSFPYKGEYEVLEVCVVLFGYKLRLN